MAVAVACVSQTEGDNSLSFVNSLVLKSVQSDITFTGYCKQNISV